MRFAARLSSLRCSEARFVFCRGTFRLITKQVFFFFSFFAPEVARLGCISCHSLALLCCIALWQFGAVVSADWQCNWDLELAHHTQRYRMNRTGVGRHFKLSTQTYLAKYGTVEILGIKRDFEIIKFEIMRFYCNCIINVQELKRTRSKTAQHTNDRQKEREQHEMRS